ncbi:MAG: hypothetical protein M3Y59_01765 [Myxococcota bacterium]|nr:hypothetical protein [Myxococcota bacterium]
MRATLPVLCLLLAGCGELYNQPLRFGTVRGTVLGADRELAFAALMGRTEERSNVEDDGRFELDEVPVGEHQLIVVITATSAVRRTLHVTGGSLTELGVIDAEPASTATLTLVSPGRQLTDDGIVWIDQFPLPALELEVTTGTATLGPLPPGCYLAKGLVEGLGEASTPFCTAGGETLALDLALPSPTGEGGREGCVRTGCQAGFSCAGDGNCY